MNGKTKGALAGVIATVIAISLVSAYIYTQNIQFGTPSSTTQTSSGQTGTLAVLMTDPPTIPEGVTAVYIDYNNLAIHVSDAGNQTGWTDLGSSGNINLLSVVNSTQTMAVAEHQQRALQCDEIQHHLCHRHLPGTELHREPGLPEGVPAGDHSGRNKHHQWHNHRRGHRHDPHRYLLLGNTTDPVFAFLPVAKGYTLPANSVSIHSHVGDHNDYKGSIAAQIHDMTHFQVSSVSLTPGSLTHHRSEHWRSYCGL